MDFRKLKPFLCDFIQYYIIDLGRGWDNNLSILLSGNTEEAFIIVCQQLCDENKDDFGYFIAELMGYFTEDELDILYNNNWGQNGI